MRRQKGFENGVVLTDVIWLAPLRFVHPERRSHLYYTARFWRNFYRAMLTHGIRSAMAKLLGLVLVQWRSLDG